MRGFLIAVLVLLCLPFAALAQQDDRDYLTAFLEDNLSSAGRKVTVTGFRGALSSQAELDSLTIADSEGVWLTLNNVVLDWSRASLLRGVVNVSELTAGEIIVARTPVSDSDAVVSPEATGFSLPDLPVSVNIDKLSVKRIELGAAILGQKIEGSLEASAKLDGGEGEVDLHLLRSDAGPEGELALKASYGNASKDLKIEMTLAEGADGIAATLLDLPGKPSLNLTINGAGPLDDFAAKLQLKTDGKDRLTGDVTLKGASDGAQMFQVSLDGDVAPLFLPDYAEFFGSKISLTAEGSRSTLGRLDLTALDLKTRAVSLTGSAVIAPDGLPEQFQLAGKLSLPDGQPVLLPLGSAVETRVTSADLNIGYDAATRDGWTAVVDLSGLDRADVKLARARIKGSGRINRRGGEGGAIVAGTLNFDTTGVDVTDPAVAKALGSDMTGRLGFDWQKGGLGLRIGRLTLVEKGYEIGASARFGDLQSGFRVKGSVDARYD
ncbi:MAG: translocation and assembly module protein TamB, partial [Pseudorhodobacter sp.]|nr:translocation and assembly module protein TamB [Pseudorhodobacter sp.]